VIPIGKRKFHRRKIGDILDPFREPGYVLAELKASDGPDGFFWPNICSGPFQSKET
jgi:hypothetical protein